MQPSRSSAGITERIYASSSSLRILLATTRTVLTPKSDHNKHPFDSPENDSCGWYTVILADSLEYGNVIDALEKKECYASNGPRINEISVIDGETVHLECSPVSKAFMFVGSKAPKRVLLPKGETGTSFDFKLHEKAQFIRITVYDEDGNVANSRGFFPEEWMD